MVKGKEQEEESIIVKSQYSKPYLLFTKQASKISNASITRSQESPSSNRKQRSSIPRSNKDQPFVMTFNENGKNFLQEQFFQINKNNSQFLNSTQTFKITGSCEKMAETNDSACDQDLQTPSMSLNQRHGGSGQQQSQCKDKILQEFPKAQGEVDKAAEIKMLRMKDEYKSQKQQTQSTLNNNATNKSVSSMYFQQLNKAKQNEIASSYTTNRSNANAASATGMGTGASQILTKSQSLGQKGPHQSAGETGLKANLKSQNHLSEQDIEEYDSDPMVNDADLQVYEDDDSEDSLLAQDNPGRGHHSGYQQDEPSKLSGYKLMKQMEDLRNNSSNSQSIQAQAPQTRNFQSVFTQGGSKQAPNGQMGHPGNPLDSFNVSNTMNSQASVNTTHKNGQGGKNSTIDNSVRSLGKSKSSELLQTSKGNKKCQNELKKFLNDQHMADKLAYSNKKDKEQKDTSTQQNSKQYLKEQQHDSDLQQYLNDGLAQRQQSNRGTSNEQNGIHDSQQQEYQQQARQRLSVNNSTQQYSEIASSHNQFQWYTYERSKQTSQQANQTRQSQSSLQQAQLIQEGNHGKEFMQSFEVGDYGMKASGMAPSIQKQSVVQIRQRPSSMMVHKNQRNAMSLSELEVNRPNILQNTQNDSNGNEFAALSNLNANRSTNQLAYSQAPSEDHHISPIIGQSTAQNSNIPLPKRRKIRPISSLCAKKANLPKCFLEDPNRANKIQIKSQKRIFSAQLTQAEKIQGNDNFKFAQDCLNSQIPNSNVTPPPQAVKFDNFHVNTAPQVTAPPQCINQQLQIDQSQVLKSTRKLQIPRPESSYGKKGRNQSAKVCQSECVDSKFIIDTNNTSKNVQQEKKIEILDLNSKEFKQVFSTPKSLSKNNPNAKKPPRIQSGQIYKNGNNNMRHNPHQGMRLISSALPSRGRQQDNRDGFNIEHIDDQQEIVGDLRLDQTGFSDNVYKSQYLLHQQANIQSSQII